MVIGLLRLTGVVSVGGSEVVGWVMLAAGLLWAGWSLRTLLQRGEGISIDDEGVMITRPPIGRLAWSEIGNARADRVRGRQFLHILLHDPERTLREHPHAARWIADRELWFDATSIGVSAHEIAERIRERST